jgi:DNA-directed RNA polymerase specialized sigma24 family protein
MDVRSKRAQATGHGVGQGRPADFARRTGAERNLLSEQIGQVLGEWQAQELRIARGFAECRGLNTEQLEDIYQETALALLRRPYVNEEHLRNALRTGLKHRALNLHRDERRRGQILAHNAPGLRLMAQAMEAENAPEPATLAKEDRLIALEFKTELTEEEQRVFAWLVEGLQYRAIASVLKIPEPEARTTARSCERKRERFQLLYEAGRLCGYRAQTILALQNGEATSEVVADRAIAHVANCAYCRLEHKTNAKRLRRSFRDQAAALLPPVLVGHLGWLARLGLRARTLQHRLAMDGVPLGQGGVRERAVALLVGGGVGAKVAAAVVTVGVIAGGAVATHVLDHPPAHHRHHVSPSVYRPSQSTAPRTDLVTPLAPFGETGAHRGVRQRRPRLGHVVSSTHRVTQHSGSVQREPGGFAYLGVPTSANTTTSVPEQATTAAHSSGGLFSP